MQTLLSATVGSRRRFRDGTILLVSMIASFLLQAGVNVFAERELIFCLIPPVALAAWFFGFKAGFLSALAIALASHFILFNSFLKPALGLQHDLVPQAAFLAITLPAAWVFSKLSRREEVLRLAQSELELILRSIGDAVLVIDRNSQVAFLNPVAEKLTGWDLETARGRPLYEVFRTDQNDNFDSLFAPVPQEAVKTSIAAPVRRNVLRSKAGVEYHIEETVAPIRVSEREQVAGAVIVFRDVSARIQAEKAALAQQEQIQAAIEVAERTQRELHSFFMQAPAPMVILMGPEHRFAMANPLYEQYVQRQVLGKTLREAFSEVEVGFYLPILNRVYETAEPYIGRDLPLTLQAEDGTLRDLRIDVSYVPLKDEEDRVKGIYVFVQDVTAQFLANERTKKYTESLEQLANSIPQIVYISDSSGRPFFLNDRWYQYTGARRLGKDLDINTYVHSDDLPETHRAWQKALETQEAFQSELRIRGADGVYRWFITRAAPNWENGTLVGWFGTSTDIHDEKEKRSEAEFLDRVAQTFSQGSKDLRELTRNIVALAINEFTGWAHVHLLEPGGRIRLVAVKHSRPEMTELSWQYDERFPAYLDLPGGLGDIIKTGLTQYQREITPEMFASAPPEQAEILNKLNLRSSISVALKTSERAFGVLTLISDERLFEKRDVLLAEQLGERSAYAIQNAQLLDELRRAKIDAERANELKSAFLANMSHEIRTPLGAMLGFADLLRDPELSAEERQNYTEILTRNGENLSVIINDILDLSKVEAGQLLFEYQKFSLRQLVEDVIKLFQVKARAKGLRLEAEFDESAPPTVVSDPLRIRQILNNIVGNAMKFTEQGYIHLRVFSDMSIGGEKFVQIEVSDSGIGIATSQKNRIFETFVQADGSVTRRFGGTGLGLSLSKRLAQALGGDLQLIESELGQGSTFLIKICDRQELNPALHDSKTAENKKMSIEEKPLQNRKILVIDDSLDNQKLIGLFLQKAGASVDFAENGLLGLEKALRHEFDLVLVDIQMPEMDGYAVTRNLRAARFKKPIVALTAHAMSDVQNLCLEAGCNGHLSKPIDRKILMQKILQLIQK